MTEHQGDGAALVCPARDGAPAVSAEGLRVYGVFTALFCGTLVISNVLAAKALDLGLFTLPASILTFPVVYIINDVLSDVFGFKRMCSAILLGFALAALAALAFHVAIALPGLDPSVDSAFAITLGSSWRILLGSLAAYLLGSLLNSYVMASLKRRFDKHLFFRCVSSTLLGETVDSLVFITIAFAGTFSPEVVIAMVASQVLFKVLYEVVLYPVTKLVIVRVRARVAA